tara:strand:- start:1253 stop:1660 length:408 start_codon:yes stop_codon:yes gene_type:complete
MKKRLFVSFFLISILFISSCVQKAPVDCVSEVEKEYIITANDKEEARDIISLTLSQDKVHEEKINAILTELDNIDFDAISNGADLFESWEDPKNSEHIPFTCLRCGKSRIGKCGSACVGVGYGPGGFTIKIDVWF